MEQVFGMVNQLLMKNSETRKRKLKMRTYKVRVWMNSLTEQWNKSVTARVRATNFVTIREKANI